MAGGRRFELAPAETPAQAWWPPRPCVEYGVCALGPAGTRLPSRMPLFNTEADPATTRRTTGRGTRSTQDDRR